MSILSLSAIMALAVSTHCGGAEPGSEMAYRLQAIAIHESGDQRSYADPLVIGVNADPTSGGQPAILYSATQREAVGKARLLLAQGRSIDLGLMQINSSMLDHDGLSVETAFDACRNMAAGASHFAADVQAVLRQAHQRYNTGSTKRGGEYADAIERVLIHTRLSSWHLQSHVMAPLAVADYSKTCGAAPPSWDGWAMAAHEKCVGSNSNTETLVK